MLLVTLTVCQPYKNEIAAKLKHVYTLRILSFKEVLNPEDLSSKYLTIFIEEG